MDRNLGALMLYGFLLGVNVVMLVMFFPYSDFLKGIKTWVKTKTTRERTEELNIHD